MSILLDKIDLARQQTLIVIGVGDHIDLIPEVCHRIRNTREHIPDKEIAVTMKTDIGLVVNHQNIKNILQVIGPLLVRGLIQNYLRE